MAVYTTIDDPEAYFQVKLYTGDGSTPSITLDGDTDMQPDIVWIKNRDATDSHCLFDAIRGTTKVINPDTNAVETTDADTLTSFDSDGFTLGADVKVNTDTEKYVAWNWKANGSGSANTDGDLSSTVSVNATSNFSMVKYTSADTGSAKTVGHGLGVAPTMIIAKQLKDIGVNWICYIEEIGNTNTMWFDDTTGSSVINYWNDTSPTTSLFTVNGLLEDAYSTIAYCFAPVQGYSKFGSYTGNGNADGTYIHLGFRPAWLLVKQSSAHGEGWLIFDSKRLGYNGGNSSHYVNNSNTEASGGYADLLSNGFKARSTNSVINGSGSTYIYMAFAEAPFVNSNGVPCNAR